MNNRQFKFRIWDKVKRCFSNDYFIRGNTLKPLCINSHGLLSTSFYEEPSRTSYLGYGIVTIDNQDDFVIQEFTGLTDKNGKEIYEGDILIYDGINDLTYRKPGIVSIGEYFTHAKEFYHFGIRVQRLDMDDSFFGLSNQDKDYLIIGNIFENPELLNK